MTLGPTQPPIQWVPEALSLGVKQPGCEADRSPPFSAKVKEWVVYTSTPQYAFMAWCSVKAQGQLYLYLYLIIYFYYLHQKLVFIKSFVYSLLNGKTLLWDTFLSFLPRGKFLLILDLAQLNHHSNWVMGWTVRIWFLATAGKELLLFATMFRLGLGPCQPPIQQEPQTLPTHR
jgi:hypothetical protein